MFFYCSPLLPILPARSQSNWEFGVSSPFLSKAPHLGVDWRGRWALFEITPFYFHEFVIHLPFNYIPLRYLGVISNHIPIAFVEGGNRRLEYLSDEHLDPESR
jgi:hypothetical protein